MFCLGEEFEAIDDSEYVSWSAQGYQVNLNPYSSAEDQIPDVRGMGLKDAVYLLESQGLTVQSEGLGKVVSQSLTPGSPAQGHSQIKLILN
jgi:cell division protein FtsI (penicillin-binding protein 3)